MSKKNYRVRNWRQYNQALVKRGSLTLWFSQDTIEHWRCDAAESVHGNQKYSNTVILCSLVVKQVYGLTLRATEGMMISVIDLLKLSLPVPDYSTICRREKTLAVKLNVKPASGARHILIDSTGIRIFGEGEWKVLKHGLERHQVWRKLHIAMDADSQMILSLSMTNSSSQDGNVLPGLLDQIDGPIRQVTGDGAYDKKCCYHAAFKRKAKAVFPPQYNAIVQRNKYKIDAAMLARDEAIRYLGDGPAKQERRAQWKEENDYHRRSLAETTMWRLKSIFGDELRAKTIENQVTELSIRCLVLNKMTELGLPKSVPIS
ncbi:MAG TPA: IS5 family transposase [Myxococcota bacterium]|nr:IS5 family transposase [Myxococcota bacterium]